MKNSTGTKKRQSIKETTTNTHVHTFPLPFWFMFVKNIVKMCLLDERKHSSQLGLAEYGIRIVKHRICVGNDYSSVYWDNLN